MNADWVTPEQLALELGQSARWVHDHMASGEIPSVRIGRQRFFTPECRAQLVEQQLTEPEAQEADTWGRPARTRRTAS